MPDNHHECASCKLLILVELYCRLEIKSPHAIRSGSVVVLSSGPQQGSQLIHVPLFSAIIFLSQSSYSQICAKNTCTIDYRQPRR